MGVRVGGGEGAGLCGARGGAGARACGGRARSRGPRQSVGPRGAAHSPPAPVGAPSHAPASYYASRVPRSLVLWCFMMVRHESARYADVP